MGKPPPPTDVKLAREGTYVPPEEEGDPTGEFTTTVTWREPRSAGTEIRVFGVTECLSTDRHRDHGRCLTKHTKLPASARTLIAKAQASEGTVSWTWPAWGELGSADTGGDIWAAVPVAEHGDETYFAIVVAAYNAAGYSRFIIAEAGPWCSGAGCDGSWANPTSAPDVTAPPPSLPVPVLETRGTEDYVVDGIAYTRYELTVANWSDYPSDLFALAPDLPPCGLNTNASRTWVDIVASDVGRIYGFCGLQTPRDLTRIWFAVPRGTAPPPGVSIVLTDRRTGSTGVSNSVSVTAASP